MTLYGQCYGIGIESDSLKDLLPFLSLNRLLLGQRQALWGPFVVNLDKFHRTKTSNTLKICLNPLLEIPFLYLSYRYNSYIHNTSPRYQ